MGKMLDKLHKHMYLCSLNTDQWRNRIRMSVVLLVPAAAQRSPSPWALSCTSTMLFPARGRTQHLPRLYSRFLTVQFSSLPSFLQRVTLPSNIYTPPPQWYRLQICPGLAILSSNLRKILNCLALELPPRDTTAYQPLWELRPPEVNPQSPGIQSNFKLTYPYLITQAPSTPC